MSTKIDQSVLEKLKKILNLAHGAGAQPGEIESAMARARELAVRHNIDLSTVKFGETEKKAAIEVEADRTLRIRSQYQQPYHKWIYAILQDVFDVHVIRHGYSTSGGKVVTGITLIGDPFDIAIAVAVFPFLEKIFPKGLSKLVTAGELTYCAADTNGYYGGLYLGIVKTNKREEEKVKETLTPDQKNQYALVVVSKETAIEAKKKEMFPKLKTQKAREIHSSDAGRYYGYQDGKKVNLRQVGAAPSKPQINH